MLTQTLLIIAAILHAAFAIGEMFPWHYPFLLRSVARGLPDAGGGARFSEAQLRGVATIVHNAGIYNVALAVGLAWAACPNASKALAFPMFVGVTIVGAFGAATLPSVPT